MLSKRYKLKSFTLIELLVVIAIIGLLASIVLVWLGSSRGQARDTKRKAEVGTISKALELYYSDNNKYPLTTDWIKIEEDANSAGPFSQAIKPYLPQTPQDPLYPNEYEPGEKYSYRYIATTTDSYTLCAKAEGGGFFCISSAQPTIAQTPQLPGEGGEGASWACGDTVTFTYKGSSVTYGTVSSQGKCWLDRNLGVSQVATTYNDSEAYGDLFQWGRLDDGHQNRNSGTTTVLSSTDVPGHSNFIYGMDYPTDWRSPQNSNLWQGVSGTNNPCPSGWRIPTSAEWDTEQASWGEQNYNGAHNSPLKLTAAGVRPYSNASVVLEGSEGYYWSSTVQVTGANDLSFSSSHAYIDGDNRRAFGFSVRCIKN